MKPSRILLGAAFAAILLPLSAFALQETVNGVTWTYTVSDGKAMIGKGNPQQGYTPAISTSTSGPIDIPASLGGYPVTQIQNWAFMDCSRLTAVTIPDGVTSIGHAAFQDCSSLASITIPDSVTSIGNYAFSGCSSLTSITIPDGVTSIGYEAFEDCAGLTAPIYSQSGTSLWFVPRSMAGSFDVPVVVTNIGPCAFDGCRHLASITMPDGVTSIGEAAFRSCAGLTSITIPVGVKSIGDNALYGCDGLEALAVADANAFYDSRNGCNAIIESRSNTLIVGCRNTVIPAGVTSIGSYAFAYCDGLTSATIPDGVTSIGDSAFYQCVGLVSVSIPEGVTSIGAMAFDGCYQLTSLTIPDGLSAIGEAAFQGCSGLTSLIIPKSVTSIGDFAFAGCSGLKTLYWPNTCPGTPSVPSDCTVVRYDDLVGLSVYSPFGEPVPARGNGVAVSNGVVRCSVSSPVEADGCRYVCSGWRGTGSVPASGAGTAVDVLMRKDSSISWVWKTNVWISCTVTGDAALVGAGSGWFPKNSTAAIFSFSSECRFLRWRVAGDAAGVVVDRSAGTISIPADAPRSVQIRFEEVTMDRAADGGGAGFSLSADAESPWFPVEDATAPDGFCLQSGAVATQPGTNALETTLTGPGRLSFVWRIDAERSDYARFYVDGIRQASIRQKPAWTTNEFDIAAGGHTLRWAFERGSANGGAAFLDDICWMPRHVLTVSSADGTPVPAVGSHDVDWGTEIAASVAAPAASGGTRRVCTGWTGTGSVPASGTGTNVTFTVEGDSTLAWNWRTEHWIDVAVVGGGSTSFRPQWVAAGTTLRVEFAPDWWSYNVALSGDTEGVGLSGNALYVPTDGPRTIRVTITEKTYSLTVLTPMGTVRPAPGVHAYPPGNGVDASAVSPLWEKNGEQVACVGWTGTGSVPASGTGTNTTFYMNENSSIAWEWATNVWIDVAVTGDGSTDFDPKWVRKESTETIELVPSTHLFAIALSGDVADGVTLDGTTLSVTADRPRTIIATITERKLPLAVSTAFGTATPSAGSHSLSWGDPVTASVAEPPPADGTRLTCIGWIGTGSVPASGSGPSVSFAMEEPSSIAWRWRIERRISLETGGPVATDFSAGWFEDGTTLTVSYDVLFGDGCAVSLSGDTNGVVHDANARTLSIPCDRVRALRLVVQPPPALTLAEALDSPGFVWTSTGANAWTPQTAVTADGEDAAASGDASGGVGCESSLETTVVGPGTLSWWWRFQTPAGGGSGLDLDVDADDNPERTLDEPGDWSEESVAIPAGEHIVRFIFWNDSGTSGDRCWVDRVAWTGAVPAGKETRTTPEPVPHAWLVAYGLAPAGAAVASYEAAALAPARNGRPVWECYVAGLDPTKEEEFRARIEMEDGEPRVLWTPSNVAGRAYAVYGKALLTNEWSSPVNASHRFFQVRVALGGASGVDESAWPGSVVVTFDPAGGSVDPATRTYDAPGALGALPTPERSGYEFLGWWTRAAGGVEVASDTVVPWANWMLYARWIPNRCTVRFLANGGAGEMPDQPFVYGEEQALDANAFSRTGFTFAGWSTNDADVVAFTDRQRVGNLTEVQGAVLQFRAVWSPNSYTVTFNRNGGSGSMAQQRFVYGTAQNLKRNTFTRNGCFFAGWATNAVGMGVYPDNAVVSNLVASGNKTLYAAWANVSDWQYTVQDGAATITRYLGTDSQSVFVPSCIGEVPVTTIGDSAFYKCSGLTSIVMPDSVTNIGSYAFYGCSGLTSITIPDSVTSIGDYAFCGCSGMTSITISDSVTSIGYAAFSGCSGLTSVTIPDSITSIGNAAFDGCYGLTDIFVEISDWAAWCTDSINANLRGTRHLVVSGKEVFDVVIPDGVTRIGHDAFCGCSGMTSITIPNSVTSIEFDAFYGCSGLTSITIPDGVTSIGGHAFRDCSGLTSITIPPSVTSIGWDAFRDCSGLTSITIPPSVTSIENDAFKGCYGLTRVMARPEWGSRFAAATNLTYFIPDGVTSIGYSAFRDCSGLTSITIPDSVTSIGSLAFYGCSGLTSITIPDGVTSIGDSAFSACSALTSVTIPDGVTSIGYRAFDGCSGLTSITIPDSVTSIGAYAFFSCSSLTSIAIPDSVTSIEDSAFRACSGLTSITIPDSVTSIEDSTFSSCSSLTSITIPDSVTSIGNEAFRDCSGLTSITIPNSVTSIGDHAFSWCSGLTAITIPESVTSIGDGAFKNCSGLVTPISNPSGTSLWFVPRSMTGSFEIPIAVTNIGASAFSDCSGLTSITIPVGVTIIGSSAFSGCSGLTSITIPEGVTSIGSSAFSGCSGLTSIAIPGSVTNIGDSAFYECSRLTSVTIPDGVTSIGNSAFYWCSGLTSITIPDGVTSLGGSAFYWCSGLTTITIPDGVTIIGDGAFTYCSGLMSILIPDSVTSIGKLAFSNCHNLTSLTIPDSVTNIGWYAFGYSGLTSLSLPGRFEGNTAGMGIPDGCTVTFRD